MPVPCAKIANIFVKNQNADAVRKTKFVVEEWKKENG